MGDWRRERAEIWRRIGSPYAQRAQQLVAQLQIGAALSGGPSPAEILQQLAPLIETVVAAVRGHRQARARSRLPSVSSNESAGVSPNLSNAYGLASATRPLSPLG